MEIEVGFSRRVSQIRYLLSRSLTVDFILFFLFHFILLFFLSSIFRTTRVRVDQSRCHISHKVDGIVIKTDHRTWKNEVEDSRIK